MQSLHKYIRNTLYYHDVINVTEGYGEGPGERYSFTASKLVLLGSRGRLKGRLQRVVKKRCKDATMARTKYHINM